MPSVVVPPSFYKQELRVYSDWKMAFWRELFQNSIDAGAKRIDITISGGVVTFTDNGIGMDRHTLENVFFALGATTKGGDTIGGFGRARIITCFAQDGYEIYTRNLEVMGHGGDYEIRENTYLLYVNGCVFRIITQESDYSLKYSLDTLLAQCSLSVDITIDGQPTANKSLPGEPVQQFAHEGDLWAKVYLEPGYGQVITRVHGLSMYTGYHSGGENVIIELNPKLSRTTLTASRDSLALPYRVQYQIFIVELNQNRRVALAPLVGRLDVVYRGSVGESFVVRKGTEPKSKVHRIFRGIGQHYSDGVSKTEDRPSTLPFALHMTANYNDSRVQALVKKWEPNSLTPRQMTLLLAWKATVEYALQTYVDNTETKAVYWGIGLIFDEGTCAMCQTKGSESILYFNPEKDGKLAYQLSSKESRRCLIANALHEVCHVNENNHNEAFACQLTDMISWTDFAEIDRVIRDV